MPVKLTKTVVQSLAPKGSRYVTWDETVPGFGIVVHPSGRKAFVLYYRTADGTQRKPSLGTYGAMTVEQGRELARDLLAKVRAGEDPSLARRVARKAETVGDICDRYLEEHADVHKKKSSAGKDRQNIDNHLRPRFATRKIQSIALADVERMHREMRKTPGAANRVLALFSKMLNLAEQWGVRPQHSNPCRFVAKYPERKLHNSISELEIARLAKVMREAEEAHARVAGGRPRDADLEIAENPNAVAALRLLIFTGCRREEVLKLQWTEVRTERRRLELADSKSGAKHVTLNTAAEEVLEAQKARRIVGNDYVFPGLRRGKPLVGLPRIWYRIRERAGLGEQVRIHDLRHAFGEIAAGSNLSLPMIGRLLGHRVAATTQRYIDFADDPQRRASELVAEKLARAMAPKSKST